MTGRMAECLEKKVSPKPMINVLLDFVNKKSFLPLPISMFLQTELISYKSVSETLTVKRACGVKVSET